jgi:peptidyl-tRNA hydrolase, PTH1 family
MIIIYGLGNNEKKYLLTKHNVGRILLEKLSKKIDIGATFQIKTTYSYCELSIQSSTNNENIKIVLLYSNGYMNESGKPLLDYLQFFKPDPAKSTLLILQDDSDQLSNKQKLIVGDNSGSAGHHGINSINKYISSYLGNNKNTQNTFKQLLRLKIGIRPENNKQKSQTFVLKSLTSTEIDQLDFLAQTLFQNIDLINNNLPKLQTIINTNSKP